MTHAPATPCICMWWVPRLAAYFSNVYSLNVVDPMCVWLVPALNEYVGTAGHTRQQFACLNPSNSSRQQRRSERSVGQSFPTPTSFESCAHRCPHRNLTVFFYVYIVDPIPSNSLHSMVVDRLLLPRCGGSRSLFSLPMWWVQPGYSFKGLSHQIIRVIYGWLERPTTGEETLLVIKFFRGSSNFLLNFYFLTRLMWKHSRPPLFIGVIIANYS
jgi:hypothetical protein